MGISILLLKAKLNVMKEFLLKQNPTFFFRLTIVSLLMLIGIVTFAQDSGLDIDVSIGEQQAWYENPVYWVIGILVLIIILLLLRRKN